MEPNEQIKISELPSKVSSLGEFIAKAGEDGLATKTTLEELAEFIGKSSGVAPSFIVSLPEGQTLGKYKNGDIVPEFPTIQEQLKDIGQEPIDQTFQEPTLELGSSPDSDALTLEVGTVLNIALNELFTQNNGGQATEIKYFKNGAELSENTDSLTLTSTETVYSCLVSYSSGSGFKTDALGNEYPNTIQAGSVVSNEIVFKGYLPIYYGSAATKPTSATKVKALTKSLVTTEKTFVLDTQNTNFIFCIWLADGLTLESIIDLDSMSANITGSYVFEKNQTVDGISGKTYIMQQDVPYDNNHKHEINLSE
jgi:hypothetical protein